MLIDLKKVFAPPIIAENMSAPIHAYIAELTTQQLFNFTRDSYSFFVGTHASLYACRTHGRISKSKFGTFL